MWGEERLTSSLRIPSELSNPLTHHSGVELFGGGFRLAGEVIQGV
jgi:hypothetical protein